MGFTLMAQQRRWKLPAEKVDRYCGDIDRFIEQANEHPQRLVPKAEVQTLLGRLSSAAGPVPRIWRHFGGVLSLVACQHFDLWVQSNRLLEALLRGIQNEARCAGAHD
eukprot:COSAG02_NODE_8242_length_2645_cov_1.472113_5_plen_107_part_01